MDDYGDPRSERDRTLIMALQAATVNLRYAFNEWLQQELRDARQAVDFLEPSLTHGRMKERLQEKRARIEDIDLRDLRDAVQSLRTRCEEVAQQVEEDPLDARFYMEEAVWRLERLVRELLYLRRFLDTFTHHGEGSDTDELEDGEQE